MTLLGPIDPCGLLPTLKCSAEGTLRGHQPLVESLIEATLQSLGALEGGALDVLGTDGVVQVCLVVRDHLISMLR